LLRPKRYRKIAKKNFFFGESWTAIEHLVSEIDGKERIPKEHLSSLVHKLMILESTVADKYYCLVQLKALRYMAREISEIYNLDVKDLKGILKIIIRDEETHRKLLSKMKKILVGKEEEQIEDKAPAFKYQNPNVWSRAMPDSVYENVH